MATVITNCNYCAGTGNVPAGPGYPAGTLDRCPNCAGTGIGTAQQAQSGFQAPQQIMQQQPPQLPYPDCINIGDWVECVTPCLPYFHQGGVYKVRGIGNARDCILGLSLQFEQDDVGGTSNGWWSCHFKEASLLGYTGAMSPAQTQMPAAPPTGKRLNAQGRAVKSEWENLFKATGCTCSAVANPPCRHCSHPGHPYKLASTKDFWEDIVPLDEKQRRANAIMEAIREMAGKGNT